MNEEVLNGGELNGAGGNAAPSEVFVIAADGYAVTARVLSGVFDGDIAAQGYAVSADVFVRFQEGNTVVVDGYAVQAEAYGGAAVEAGGYAVQAGIDVLGRDSAIIVADGYAVAAAVAMGARGQLVISAEGYAVGGAVFGGATLAAQGYAVEAGVNLLPRANGIIDADGYAVQAAVSVTPRFQMAIAAQGYAVSAEAFGGGVIDAAGYAVQADLTFAGVSLEGHDQALVMNTHTAQVSRYTNYTFMSLITLDGKPYGVRHDGIYRLSEDHDETALNGSVLTKATDFSSFQSKRVPYCYLNNDTKVNITPFVDDVEKLPHASQFAGRKIHLARGPSGRYWQFQIDAIKQLEGVEFTPQLAERKRRVK